MTTRPMQRALRLAKRGEGTTSPNPMVGAVITTDAGEVIAEGYHKKAGGPHAERLALTRAGDRARGQTLYVTLEPCNHTGRTPPCTEAIIASGVRKVVVATKDPNPEVSGGGIERLSSAGIDVVVGDGEQEATQLNQPFITWCVKHRPLVTLKVATSLDGKVAATDGTSKYLTSAGALAYTHELRRRHDAILIGIGTALADDPALTYRGTRKGSDPIRVVLDSHGRLKATSRLFHAGSMSPTLVFTTERASRPWERDIFSAGGEVIHVAADQAGHTDLGEVLTHLHDRHVLSVLVEGGPRIHAGLIIRGIADRWIQMMAPLILGDPGLASVGPPGYALTEAPRLIITRVLRKNPDVIIEADFKER